MEKIIEEWREISEMKGYFVSNVGRVRSSNKFVKCKGGGLRMHKGKILSTGFCNGEYPIVVISNHCKTRTLKVHRLVAMGFIQNIENHPEVNHIDGNIENNRMGNLEWCDKKHNMQHAVDTKLMGSKITKEHIELINQMYRHSSKAFNIQWMANCFGFSANTIKKHIGGYKWKK